MENNRLPSLKPKEVIRILKRLGFHTFRQKGSHIIMIREGDNVHQPVIPYHNKDLKKGTLKSIIRQIGLTIGEFNQLRKK